MWVVSAMLCASVAYAVCIPAPDARGSGIPEMKVLLGGNDPNPGFLLPRTLVAKFVGVVCALGGGLPIGTEGPFVHIAACLGSILRRVASDSNSTSSLHMLLSMSVAAGVTATFGAPVGGILFSIEVTTTYFFVSNLWRCFVCATVCVLSVKSLHAISVVGLFEETHLPQPSLSELPFFFVLGLCCGVVATAFVRLTKVSMVFVSRWTFSHAQLVYTMAIGALAASVSIYYAPLRFADRVMINSLFSMVHVPNDHALCLGLIGTKLFITTLALSCAIPCGVFTPTFVLGAAVGRLYGLIVKSYFPFFSISHPALYAVMGAAGVTAGVTRTMSVSMIVFELTGQIHHMPFLLVTVVVSYGVSSFLGVSIFDFLIRQKRLLFLPHGKILRSKAPDVRLTAGQMMRPLPPLAILSSTFDKQHAKEITETWRDLPLPIVSATNTLQALYFADVDEIDNAPLSVPLVTPITQIHFMFTMLTLKYIVVTDPANNGCPVGIISRKTFV